eukprot:gene29684-38813_t
MRDVAFVLALGLYASIQTAVSFKFLSTRRSVIHSQGFSGLRSTSLQMVSTPHGGKLVNTMVVDNSQKNDLIASCDIEAELDERQLCDVELLMQGGFSPLDGYMDEADYKSVVNDLKLSSGLIFGLPVVYDTSDPNIVPGKRVLLKYNKVPIAVMDVTSKYLPNKALEAKKCYGTTSIEHPAVSMITTERGKYYCGGKITGLNVPTREFPCKSPELGNDFYGAYDAQDFAISNSELIGVTPVPSLNLVYTQEEDYVTAEYAKEKGLTIKNLSGTKFRQMLRAGDDIPTWFAFESVVKVLREEAQAAPN